MSYTYVPRTVAQALAITCGALKRCRETPATHDDWTDRHLQTINNIQKQFLPSGSGIDNGTKVDTERSADERLALALEYHHMNADGYYDGWTEHTVTVRAGFNGLLIQISGPNRNDIKDYLHETLNHALSHELTRAEWFRIHGAADPDELKTA